MRLTGKCWMWIGVACPVALKGLLPGIGYLAKQRNRRGRQLGRVLATRSEEIVVDRLFDGKTQLTKARPPLMEAAEMTLELDQAKRARTMVRVDAGGGSLGDLNWLLERGYQVHGKDYSGRHARVLAQSVEQWFDDPHVAGRQMGPVWEAPTAYVRPVVRIAVRCRQQNGQWAVGVLISTLSARDVLHLTGCPLTEESDPLAVRLSYVAFYDQRGGGIETSFKGDKQGLGMTKRNKKHFAAQQIRMRLRSLAQHVVVWARRWLAVPQVQRDGIVRMVRDVFHVSGCLCIDALGQVTRIVLNQDALLARSLVNPLREWLTPLHVVIHLDKT
jgi:hypothetical protein